MIDLVPPQRRREAGEALRQEVPLEDQCVLETADRPNPVQLLAAQDRTRLAELVPIRHQRMGASPFTFYRGSAAVMASDLARLPSVGVQVQLCGDAHLSNFGLFNSPDRRLVFDVNDFDETLPGSFEWDLKRLAASVTIAGRHNGLSSKEIRKATRASVRGYRKIIERAVGMSPLDVHYQRIEVESLIADNEKVSKRSRSVVEKATSKTSVRAVDKLTAVVDGRRRIVANPPLVTPIRDRLEGAEGQEVLEFFRGYRASLPPHRSAVLDRYRILDVAHKVVGVGSVGTRCLIVLLESDGGSPLVLQFKEAGASALELHREASNDANGGERVVRGQRLMQATGDIFLGWSRFVKIDGSTVDFYFRQMWDGKGSVEVEDMGPKRLKNYADHCGGTLGLAHARTGDAAMISGYLGDDSTIDHVLADFAERYADLNDLDYAEHAAAIAAGVLPAPPSDGQ